MTVTIYGFDDEGGCLRTRRARVLRSYRANEEHSGLMMASLHCDICDGRPLFLNLSRLLKPSGTNWCMLRTPCGRSASKFGLDDQEVR